MNPQQTDPQNPAAPNTPQTQAAAPAAQAAPAANFPKYRSYWWFALILLVFWPAGLVILFTGDIYHKQKDGSIKPISMREKVTLTVVILLLVGFGWYSRLHG